MAETTARCGFQANRCRQVCDPCKIEDLSSPSSGFCLVCGDYMCQQCIRDHRKNKASRKHKILGEDELPTNAQTSRFLKEFLLCKDHSDREFRYKCETHDVFVCDVCIGSSHRECDKITDLSTRENTFKTETLAKSLLELKEKLQICKETKNKSISKLLKQAERIKAEQESVVTSIVNHLEKLDEQCQIETEKIAKSLHETVDSSIVNCKNDDMKLAAFIEVLRICMKSGKSAFKHIAKNMIAKHIDENENRARMENSKEEMHIEFIKNTFFEEINTIGKVKLQNIEIETGSEDADVIQQKSEKRQDTNDQNPVDSIKISKTGTSNPEEPLIKNLPDIKETETENVIKIKKYKEVCSFSRISESAVEVNKFPWKNIKTKLTKKHSVRVKTDIDECKIIGIVIFSDGCMAILDSTNKKIKLFNVSLKLVNFLLLSDEPLAITKCLENEIALLHEDGNEISVFDYIACRQIINKRKQFCVPTRCLSVSHNTEHLVLLRKKTGLESSDDETHILIYDISHEKIIKTIVCSSYMLKNPTCLMSKSQNVYIIGDDRRVCCFSKTGQQMWFYKQYMWSNEIKDVVSLTADENGNIIACCQGSKNVHVISSETYLENSVILTGKCGMKVVHYDVINLKLIVGHHGDHISIVQFEKE